MATLVLGAVGAGIGSMIGGTFLGMSATALGWNIGSLLGGYLFAPKQPTQYGPRLGDLKVQTSTYGNPIPVLFGSTRVAGNMIWSAPIVETAHSQTSGGKGGGGGVTQVSFTYSQSFAIAICDCEIVGIRKIWANGELIYNISGTADAATLIASNQLTPGFRIYTGSETQMADSLIQANIGAADTPAYRGTAYVVFENLQLANYGNRTPNLEFEVIRNGTYSTSLLANILAPLFAPIDGNTFYPACSYYANGNNIIFVPQFKYTAWGGTPNAGPYHAYRITGSGAAVYIGEFSTGFEEGSGTNTLCYGKMDIPACATVCETGNHLVIIDIYGDVKTFNIPGEVSGARATKYGQNVYYQFNASGYPIRKFNYSSLDPEPIAISANLSGNPLTLQANDTYLYRLAYGTNKIERYNPVTLALIDEINTPAAIGYAQIDVVSDMEIYLITGAGTNDTIYKYDGSSWTNLGFDIDGIYGNSATFKYQNGIFIYSCESRLYFYACTLSKNSTTLDYIVTDICAHADLAAGQINVTALTDTVDGYVVQRGTARSWLEQLMQAFFFDAVESDGKIKFVKRGGAAVAAIPEADLAAHEYGSTPPDTLIINRQQEMELPVEVAIQYMDIAAAYQIGSQASRRLTTESENQQSINLAISMTGTKARQISEVLMYDTWTARTSFDSWTGWKYSYLEPTDVVTITKAGRTYTARLVDEDAAGGIFRHTALLEDAGIYTQTPTAAPISVPADTVSLVPLTNLILMDIPLLRDQDEGVGFYAAACGYGTGWSGAQTYKSNDGGLTWNSYGRAFLNGAAIGNANGVLGVFYGKNIFDELNSISVILMSGMLASDTAINVLNGANVALLGDEIIQFKTATLTATNTYTLTGLLRGRCGTGWAQLMHVTSERFVLLSETTTYLFDASNSEYDLARDYKGVSFGGFLDDAPVVPFTHTAVALHPYAPVLLGGGRNADLDVILKWVRRTRVGGAWNNYADVPLGETTEAYEVEIWNSTYTVLKRTITGISSATTTYTAAQQTTDFGSAQATVYFKVYQISAIVGRGNAAFGSC